MDSIKFYMLWRSASWHLGPWSAARRWRKENKSLPKAAASPKLSSIVQPRCAISRQNVALATAQCGLVLGATRISIPLCSPGRVLEQARAQLAQAEAQVSVAEAN